MTWDVPVKEDCPVCGHTMFKKSGRGFKKPFCINEKCSNFTPEDKRGGYRKKAAAEDGGETAAGADAPAEEKSGTKKAAAKKTAEKKTAGKKTAAKSTTAKKAAAKKSAARKKAENPEAGSDTQA